MTNKNRTTILIFILILFIVAVKVCTELALSFLGDQPLNRPWQGWAQKPESAVAQHRTVLQTQHPETQGSLDRTGD